jgi:hypothetical protein
MFPAPMNPFLANDVPILILIFILIIYLSKL